MAALLRSVLLLLVLGALKARPPLRDSSLVHKGPRLSGDPRKRSDSLAKSFSDSSIFVGGGSIVYTCAFSWFSVVRALANIAAAAADDDDAPRAGGWAAYGVYTGAFCCFLGLSCVLALLCCAAADRRPSRVKARAGVLPGGAFADLRACASPAVAGEDRSATAEGRARPTARLGAARNVLASCELLFYSAVVKLLGLSTVSSYRALVDNLVPDPSERLELVLALGLTPIFIIVVLAAFTAVFGAVRRTRQEEDRLRQ